MTHDEMVKYQCEQLTEYLVHHRAAPLLAICMGPDRISLMICPYCEMPAESIEALLKTALEKLQRAADQ